MGKREIKVNEQKGMAMTEKMFRKKRKKITNSKARGRDDVQGLLFKKLSNCVKTI